MKFKKLLALVLIVGLLTAHASTAFAQENTLQIQVMLDGQYVDFPDTAPTLLNDRTFVPIGPIMDSLGATYTYTPETQVIAAQYGDTTVYLAIGEPGMTLEKAGKTQSVNLDVAPMVIEDRTMVPVRLLDLAFALSTSWDAANQTVVIIDFAKLRSRIDQNYSLSNRLMYSYDPQTTYAMAGEFSEKTNMTVTPPKMTISATSINTINMLIQNNNFSVDYHLNLNAGLDLKNPSADTPTEFLDSDFGGLMNLKGKFIFNSRTGTLYANLGSLNTFGGYDADTWFKLNLLDLVPDPDVAAEIKNILNSDTPLTLGDYFDLFLNRSDAYNTHTYEGITFILDLCDPLFSDQAYTLTGGAEEQPTYTYQISTASIVNAVRSALVKHPTLAPSTLDSLSKFPQDAVQFKFNSTITFLDDYQQTGTSSLDFSFNLVKLLAFMEPGLGDANFMDKYLYSGSMQSETNIPGKSTISAAYQMSMKDMTMDMSMRQAIEGSLETLVTTEKVPSAPPANSKIHVVDLKNLFGFAMYDFTHGY